MSYSFPDYYAVLGISSSVSAEELKRAYRRQARLLHPDRNPDDASLEDGFKRLSQAYQVLSNPELRAEYDKSFQEHMQNQNAVRINNGQKPLGSFFRKLFGTQPAPTIHGQDLRYHLTLQLSELFESSLMLIELPSSRACNRCDGKGRYADEICRGCLGAGRESFVNRLEVKIPPGVDNGMQIKVKGEGERGIVGGRDGDLYIEIHVEPHPLLKRKGSNLVCEIPIPLSVAVCGGDVGVPYAKNDVRLKIPAGTQSNQMFRLKGKGLPVSKSSQVGDLLVTVVVETPQGLAEEQRGNLQRVFELVDQHLRYPRVDAYRKIYAETRCGQKKETQTES